MKGKRDIQAKILYKWCLSIMVLPTSLPYCLDFYKPMSGHLSNLYVAQFVNNVGE